MRMMLVCAVSVVALGFATAEFGAVSATVPNIEECAVEDSVDELDGHGSCRAWACRAECGSFGGDYIAGSCYCCG